MVRLLYSSVSELNSSNETDEIASIVKASIARNAQMGVTGALIYTGSHFIQALEGDEEQVEELMRSIVADSRHSHSGLSAPRSRGRGVGWQEVTISIATEPKHFGRQVR